MSGRLSADYGPRDDQGQFAHVGGSAFVAATPVVQAWRKGDGGLAREGLGDLETFRDALIEAAAGHPVAGPAGPATQAILASATPTLVPLHRGTASAYFARWDASPEEVLTHFPAGKAIDVTGTSFTSSAPRGAEFADSATDRVGGYNVHLTLRPGGRSVDFNAFPFEPGKEQTWLSADQLRREFEHLPIGHARIVSSRFDPATKDFHIELEPVAVTAARGSAGPPPPLPIPAKEPPPKGPAKTPTTWPKPPAISLRVMPRTMAGRVAADGARDTRRFGWMPDDRLQVAAARLAGRDLGPRDKQGQFSKTEGREAPGTFSQKIVPTDKAPTDATVALAPPADPSDDLIEAIDNWTSAYGNRFLASALRDGNPDAVQTHPGLPGPPSPIRPTVDALDAAIAQQVTTADMTLYRGINGHNVVAKDLAVGAVVTDLAFVSTTSHKPVATLFVKAHHGHVVQIQVPKGTHALNIGGFHDEDVYGTDGPGHGPDDEDAPWGPRHIAAGVAARTIEREILLPRGTTFTVIKNDGGTMVLRAGPPVGATKKTAAGRFAADEPSNWARATAQAGIDRVEEEARAAAIALLERSYTVNSFMEFTHDEGTLPARQIANLALRTVGLTRRQAAQITALIQRLGEADGGELVRVGGRTYRIPPDGAGSDWIDDVTSHIALDMVGERAEDYATELTQLSLHEGQRQVWARAQEEGRLSAYAEKILVLGPRPCPFCQAIADAGPVPVAEGFGVPGPPFHPNCMCTEQLI